MILISGEGASGSSFLVWLLRELGYSICPKGMEEFFQDLDTGEPVLYELLREGRITEMMRKGQHIEWPDVIKDLGKFSMNLHHWVDRFNWKVDHVFITVRDLEEGIARRHAKQPMSAKFLQLPYSEFKHLTTEEKSERARKLLRERLGSAVYFCLARNYPYTILKHPDWLTDPIRCWEAVGPVANKSKEEFLEIYHRIVDINKAKTYGEDD